MNIEMKDYYEKTLAVERKYDGRIINVDLIDIELPDGRRTKREVVRHGSAVAVLARRHDGKFILVRQYRKAVEDALWEIVAGGIEDGESSEEAARRETAEETGYDVVSLKYLTKIVCTPGYCEESIYIYFAEVGEKPHDQDQDPDENVHPFALSEEEIEKMIAEGDIYDSKTLSAWACYLIANKNKPS